MLSDACFVYHKLGMNGLIPSDLNIICFVFYLSISSVFPWAEIMWMSKLLQPVTRVPNPIGSQL
jgi:hypothetical protein